MDKVLRSVLRCVHSGLNQWILLILPMLRMRHHSFVSAATYCYFLLTPLLIWDHHRGSGSIAV